MDEQMTAANVDTAATHLDEIVDGVRHGKVLPVEAVVRAADVLEAFGATGSPDITDQDLLYEYAHEMIDQMATWCRDLALVDWFEDLVAGTGVIADLRAELDAELDAIETRHLLGEPDAAVTLVELCRDGAHSHRRLLRIGNAVERILRTAHRLAIPAALREAVDPAGGPHRIAHTQWGTHNAILALDLLAHLAADPHAGSGTEARDALVHLTGCLDLAGEAAVRLPLHLLTDEQRSQLLRNHEARSDLFEDDPVHIPLPLDITRDNRVIRGALWQAFDATHL